MNDFEFGLVSAGESIGAVYAVVTAWGVWFVPFIPILFSLNNIKIRSTSENREGMFYLGIKENVKSSLDESLS